MQKKQHDQVHSGMKHSVPRTLQGCLVVDCFLQYCDFQKHPSKSPPVLQWFVLKTELDGPLNHGLYSSSSIGR